LTKQRSGLDRVLSAFNHPVRRRILRELVAGPASASMISRAFRMELGVVSYHLNRVLAQHCKVVELVESVPRRGSVEKFYELRVDGPLDLPSPGEPGSWDEMLWTLALGQKLFEAIEGTKSKR
jgi:DNA-binding transcriptional ArsR family regulator